MEPKLLKIAGFLLGSALAGCAGLPVGRESRADFFPDGFPGQVAVEPGKPNSDANGFDRSSWPPQRMEPLRAEADGSPAYRPTYLGGRLIAPRPALPLRPPQEPESLAEMALVGAHDELTLRKPADAAGELLRFGADLWMLPLQVLRALQDYPGTGR